METSSTTAAAARAAADEHAGALAGLLAAEKYGLEVRHENVEDLAENITRFLVLSKTPAPVTGDDKTSIMFAVRDKVGALYDTLLPFKANNLNMTMIQSRPSKRKSWEYVFFVDFAGHISEANCAQVIRELSEHTVFVKVLGSYPRSSSPF